MFGPSVISVLGTICLLFQALLLAHGGLTTLGANAFSMAAVGPFLYGFAVYKFSRSLKLSKPVSHSSCVAMIADLATYATTSLQLVLVFQIQLQEYSDLPLSSWESFSLQNSIAIVEGLLTVIFYNLISENASERGSIPMKNIRIFCY